MEFTIVQMVLFYDSSVPCHELYTHWLSVDLQMLASQKNSSSRRGCLIVCNAHHTLLPVNNADRAIIISMYIPYKVMGIGFERAVFQLCT